MGDKTDQETQETGGGGTETQRLDALEQRTGRMENTLGEIKDLLGKGRDARDDVHDKDSELVERRLDRGSRMQDDMRQAVRDVQAEAAKAEAERQHAADHQNLRQQKAEPETQPREVMVKGKARLQKLMFGDG